MSFTASTTHSGGSNRSATTTTTRTRRWVRRDWAVMPFVWAGLLPLLGLLALLIWALWPFARGDIERNVRERTQSALAANGFGWVQTAVSGQHVVLSGSPPNAEAGVAALSLARGLKCPTWAGEQTCAVDVRPDWTNTPPVAPRAPVAATTNAPATAAVQEAAKQCETALADLLASRKIEFATGKAQVLPKSFALLDEIAKTAKDCPGTIEVQGHTDSVGASDMNKALSQARADAVATLLGQRGLDAARLKPTGYGADQPIGDNATPAGRAQNRRIEFRIATN